MTCERCGHENDAGAKFCSECGTALRAPPAREERKLVTVLFCDLVGSTAQAERLDPEDVRAMLSRYHEHVRRELERHGGTVEKFIGDAVMALFGAPVSHEDDPERAVRAALAIRDWAQQESDLEVRIGITTGEALVSLGARPDQGEGMAAGDVVNTAARLQGAAAENGILVDETTYRATQRAIEYQADGSVTAKGKEQPVAVWEPRQARSRFGVDVRQHARALLVGRADELDALQDAFRRARRDRSPQLVTLVGVPGIGKSRLVRELFQWIDEQTELTAWRQGRSLPYGDGITFWALGEMIKSHGGILETDTDEDARAKLRRIVDDAVPDGADATWIASHLGPLVGLGGDEAAARGDAAAERFAAWRRFFEALADQRPLVLVFEDLHWADDQLLDFVDHLVDWSTGVPLLVVVTARPELLGRRSGWGGGKANATTLSLAPLTDDETRVLVHRLLDRSVLAADVQTMLLERAAGNPLYAEEFIRMITERGLAEAGATLPESVQGLIAARLDGLDEEEKRVLQAASVLGKVFWLGAVVAIAEVPRWEAEVILHLLERKEFVRRERRSSVGGETEYAFGHVLVRDVAYAQIPRSDRGDKHRRAAEWVESLGRADDHAELLAHHFATALELARLAGSETPELVERTRNAHFDAADRAQALNAFSRAADSYERALGLADGDVEPRRLLNAGRAFRWSRGSGDDLLARARDGLIAGGDAGAAAEAEVLRADLSFSVRGDFPQTKRHVASAMSLVEPLGPSRSKAFVLAQAARFSMLAFDSEVALKQVHQALELIDRLGLDDLRAGALNTRGVARKNLGDRAGGIRDLEESLECAIRTNAVTEIGRVYNNLGSVLMGDGDFARGRDVLEEGMAKLSAFPEQSTLSQWLIGNLTIMQFEAGEWDDAVTSVDDYLAAAASGEGVGNWSLMVGLRAGIWGARGETERALSDVEQLVERANATGDPANRAGALGVLVYVQYAAGNLDAARAAASEFIEVVRGVKVEFVGAYAGPLCGLGFREETAALLAAGRDEYDRVSHRASFGDYAGAADEFARMSLRRMEAEMRLLAAQELVAQGRQAEADAQGERALRFFESVKATPYVKAAQSLLAATA
jgi:class 3 adenylate cyclase/tetratricopeptide (TPR) repeat protein